MPGEEPIFYDNLPTERICMAQVELETPSGRIHGEIDPVTLAKFGGATDSYCFLHYRVDFGPFIALAASKSLDFHRASCTYVLPLLVPCLVCRRTGVGI